ncbi:transposase [Streptosporangium subroseum]|uniref:transposase n=1 Tax=Streptosporangium subroseum TaxID=106412 RepID=UPI00308ED8C1|nr:hypothetical protein OHB15_14285 [Streptosporangium subroseum]
MRVVTNRLRWRGSFFGTGITPASASAGFQTSSLPEELAKEFQPSAPSIRLWARQADLDDGRRQDGLTSAEKDELARLRRENKILREEKDILHKAAAFFARETDQPR